MKCIPQTRFHPLRMAQRFAPWNLTKFPC